MRRSNNGLGNGAMRKKNWLIWLLAILLRAAIFSFSAQNANTSGTLSKKVTLQIIDTLPQTRELSELQKVDMVRETENIVRKSAHFVLFAVLAVCITLVMGTFMKKKWLIYLAAVAFCFLYACSDELHQLFVDGRGASLSDVFLDTAGAVAGILLYMMIKKIFRRQS